MRIFALICFALAVGLLLDKVFPGLTMRDPLALFFVLAILAVSLTALVYRGGD